jgi:hypothetical protein
MLAEGGPPGGGRLPPGGVDPERLERPRRLLAQDRDEALDQAWVALRARAVAEGLHRVGVGQGPAVRPVARHGLVGLGYEDDPRQERDGFTGEAGRIARAVVTLVMVTDRLASAMGLS